MRLVTLLLGALLLVPATASAADVSISLESGAGVQYGSAHQVRGRLAEGTAPLAGQAIELRGRAYPYEGDFSTLATTVTDGAGAFGFDRKFDRNMQLQVVAPPQGAFSKVVRAYVFPRPKSTFKALAGGRLRITQILRTPAEHQAQRQDELLPGAQEGQVGLAGSRPPSPRRSARAASRPPRSSSSPPPGRAASATAAASGTPRAAGSATRRQLPQEVPLLGRAPARSGRSRAPARRSPAAR